MKSSYVLFFFVLVNLIASAQSTTCDRCWNVGDTECCGDKTIECPNSSCMTISENCVLGGKEYSTVRKTCGDNTTCGLCFSVSTNQGLTVLASTQCGEGDKSNADLDYKITCEALEKENGYWCPACYNNNSMEGCDAGDNKVLCRGLETECVDYAGIVQLSDGDMKSLSAQGCIMQGGCKLGFAALPGAREMKSKKFICSPATKE
nr:sodefrin precursor-like factor A [Plectrohyla sagorum]